MYVNRGETCPVCEKRPAEHVAVQPMVKGADIILPDDYAVCPECHRTQYVAVYGHPPGKVPPPPRRPRKD